MAKAGEHDQLRAGDIGVEVVGHEPGGADVVLAVEEERGDVDVGEGGAEVGLGEGPDHGLAGTEADVVHDAGELLGGLGRHDVGEQAGEGPGHERLLQGEERRQPGLDLLGRQRPRPSGVGPDQHQGPGDRRVAVGEGDGQASAEGVADHVGPVEVEGRDEPGQAVGVVGQAEESGGSSDRPQPGASQATTVNSSARSAIARRHTRPSDTPPWRRTTGGPSPAPAIR